MIQIYKKFKTRPQDKIWWKLEQFLILFCFRIDIILLVDYDFDHEQYDKNNKW